MPFLIFFLMISWPVLEVASIIQVSRWVGPLVTFLLLAGGFAFGAFVVRSSKPGCCSSRHGGGALRHAARETADRGRNGYARRHPLHGPGFVSDAVAMLLLIPQIRDLIWRGLSYGFRSGQPVRTQPRPGPQTAREQEKPQRQDDVIDVEFTEVPRNKSSGGSRAKPANSPWGKAEVGSLRGSITDETDDEASE